MHNFRDYLIASQIQGIVMDRVPEKCLFVNFPHTFFPYLMIFQSIACMWRTLSLDTSVLKGVWGKKKVQTIWSWNLKKLLKMGPKNVLTKLQLLGIPTQIAS